MSVSKTKIACLLPTHVASYPGELHEDIRT